MINRGISRRIVPMVAVIALLLNLAAPQRARALAVTATVAASAAAILTACGVTYWAATQTDAIDYISGKLEDYLSSIEIEETPAEWLEVSASSQPFTVISGGLMQFTSGVANKLLDFVRWFQTEENIESGGDALVEGEYPQYVSNISGYSGDITASFSGLNQITVTLNNVSNGSAGSFSFGFPVSLSGKTVIVTLASVVGNLPGGGMRWSIDSGNAYGYSNTSYTGATVNSFRRITTAVPSGRDYLWLVFSTGSASGTNLALTFNVELSQGNVMQTITSTVTPSDFVNVPSNIEDGSSFVVSPGVSLSAGDTVDDASQAIFDGITSQDGLSSTVEETPDTALGWLYTLLANIASTIGAGISDIKDKLDGVKSSSDDAAAAAQGAATAAQGVEQAVEGLQSTAEAIEDNTDAIVQSLAPATYGDASNYQLDLTSLFPFCIPRDIYTAISLFASEPEAPSIDWDMPLPNGSTYHIDYDLSQWDSIASLLRHLELLLYGVGLMMATKSIIKW